MVAIDLEIERLHALRTIQSCLLRLKWLAAATRFEIAMHRHDRALKAGFNPEQPRDEIGRWADTGAGQRRIRLAGEIPTNDPPEIPEERPATSGERTAALKLVARMLGVSLTVAEIAKRAAWLQTYSAQIETYRDPPRSLEELQQRVSTPEPGYDKHHIVERNQEGRFTKEAIDSPDNLVRIPRLKHQEINAWYQTKNSVYGGVSPREYLNGRSWSVQRAVGLDALKKSGVLTP